MISHQSLSPAGKSRKGFTMSKTQVAYRYFQIAVLVALLAALLLAAAPAITDYVQGVLAQLVHSIFVLGQMTQGIIIAWQPSLYF